MKLAHIKSNSIRPSKKIIITMKKLVYDNQFF